MLQSYEDAGGRFFFGGLMTLTKLNPELFAQFIVLSGSIQPMVIWGTSFWITSIFDPLTKYRNDWKPRKNDVWENDLPSHFLVMFMFSRMHSLRLCST